MQSKKYRTKKEALMKRMKIKRIVRTAVAAVLSLFTAVSFCSCSLGDAFLSAMGFDTHDYEAEEVVEILPSDNDEVVRLCEMIKILSVNDPILPEFSSSGEAEEKCRDSVLNYMLCTEFAKYMGNNDLIEKVRENYPEFNLISVIPGEDFEDFVYTYFGGNAKLSHSSSELFTYLDKADAYTSVTVPVESNITFEVINCEKTERTYRFKFKCIAGDFKSPVYETLIINRSDGSSYFKWLRQETK